MPNVSKPLLKKQSCKKYGDFFLLLCLLYWSSLFSICYTYHLQPHLQFYRLKMATGITEFLSQCRHSLSVISFFYHKVNYSVYITLCKESKVGHKSYDTDATDMKLQRISWKPLLEVSGFFSFFRLVSLQAVVNLLSLTFFFVLFNASFSVKPATIMSSPIPGLHLHFVFLQHSLIDVLFISPVNFTKPFSMMVFPLCLQIRITE